MKRRKIAVISGSRADYGHLYCLIENIKRDPALELQLVVTGMHLSREFGYTVSEIRKDGFPIKAEARILRAADTERAIAASMGSGIIKFADIYERLKPDIVVVLGDRFEIHAAVTAALPFRIPVAHIHGGESTEGVMDESMRHSITKMSHMHFATNARYRDRIIQMGERPESVFCFGSPGLDNIRRLKLLSRKELLSELNIPEDRKIGIVTFHPVTLEDNTAARQVNELFRALLAVKDVFWIFTASNADREGRLILAGIRRFVKKHSGSAKLFLSLGQRRYLSLMKNADVMVGNSSSGIIEAPSLELPVVNIGDRQRNRIRARNVVDVADCRRRSIVEAVKKALSPEFKRSLNGLRNPYGNGRASGKIAKVLKTISISESMIKKEFFDIET